MLVPLVFDFDFVLLFSPHDQEPLTHRKDFWIFVSLLSELLQRTRDDLLSFPTSTVDLLLVEN